MITGFRLAYGGAQARYGVTPDLTVLGKVMGGGFPCAAFGGRRELMEQLAPAGPVYQAGTLSGNPVAVAAGIAALDLAKELDPYAELDATADGSATGSHDLRAERGRRPRSTGPSRCSASSSPTGRSANYEDAKAADHERYGRFFHHMLDKGVYLPPSGYELWTLGTAHGEAEIAAIMYAATSFTG